MNVDSNEEDHDLGGKRDANIDQRQQRQNNNSTNYLIVLTLKKHRDGIWITKLVERLQAVQQHEQQRNCNSPGPHIEIQVRALEDWFVEGSLVSDPSSSSMDLPSRSNSTSNNTATTIVGIINRVSDAAAPDLYKLCCTVLQVAAQLWHIPVWNGPNAYRLCGNKWCHHLLFRQAKLSSPTTLMYYTGDSTNNNDDDDDDNDRNNTEDNNKKTMNIDIDTSLFRRNRSSTRKHDNTTDDTDDTNNTMELLIKPNSGGFGAGIQRLSFAVPSIASSSSSSSSSSCIQTVSIPVTAAASSSLNTDKTLLIQQYEPPHEGWIYRVWFLNGTIQCAIQRRIRKDVHHDDNTAEFTAGCAAGATVGSTCRHNIPISSSSSSGSTNNCSSISSTEANNTNNTPTTIAADRKHATAVPNHHQHVPWKVPDDVRHEIEDQLLPLLPDAHCGSIEFLYAQEEEEEVGTTPDPCRSPRLRRLYFDLNLLSTLPIIEDDDNNNNNKDDSTLTDNAVDRDNTNPTMTMVWPKKYDPWLELAQCIWEFVFRTTTTTTTN